MYIILGELAGFEEAWEGNARKHLPGWTEGISKGKYSTHCIKIFVFLFFCEVLICQIWYIFHTLTLQCLLPKNIRF